MSPTGKNDNVYVPPTMWKDLTDAEKIKRLREEVKNREWRIVNLEQRLSQLEQLVKNHNHLENGDVVQKVNAGFGGGLGTITGNSALKAKSENPDDVYF